ncbi:FAD:protein FMN transferase [Cellulomonas algicola]|uniref:FAD:protein FMN transferase n=1 Tax=Cellulomonas algicola TaxID=2071633 RepID=A0A401V2E1_9CELL|nr:FAD:protein FMN transferase [Cellulomonas algicola]GCD21082.1 FAD:protein FMN transferase [Cellulomonas algicola]
MTAVDASAAPRRAWVEHHMGMPWSVHVRGEAAHDELTERLVAQAFAEVDRIDALLSPFRDDSELSRLRRGELALADAAPELQEVERLCRAALARTLGWFDAWRWRDGFDPTGLVKGWAVARAARILEPIASDVAVDAGGDLAARCVDPDGTWLVGVEDPVDRTRVLATVPVGTGAVATSGTAARGSHIADPRTGVAATGVRQATVIGPSVLWADVFATAAVAQGVTAVDRVHELHGTSGVLVLDDGSTHAWSNPV